MILRVPVPFEDSDALSALREFVLSLSDPEPLIAAIVHDVGEEFDRAGMLLHADQVELVSNTVTRTVDAITDGLRLAMLQALSDKVELVMSARGR